MRSSLTSLKVLCILWIVYSTYAEQKGQTMHVYGHFQEVKNIGKL